MFSVSLPGLIELMRRSLEARIDALGGSLSLWTSIVVAGLILEYGMDFVEKAAHHGARKGGRKEPWLPVWFARLRWLEIVGAIMVVAGVSGELTTEATRGDVEGRLRDLSNSVIAGVRQETARADERAGNVGIRLEEERQKTARFQKEATDTERALVSDLTAEKKFSGDAAAQLEAEKKKRLDLAGSLLPRQIDNEDEIISSLTGTEGTPVLFEVIHDREAIRTAQLIHTVLSGAKWRVYWRFATDEESVIDGVSIAVGAYTPPKSVVRVNPLADSAMARGKSTAAFDLAWRLRNSLIANGMDVYLFTDQVQFLPVGTILIRVGLKPDAILRRTLTELGKPQPVEIIGPGGFPLNFDPSKMYNLRTVFLGNPNADEIVVK